MVPTNQDFLDRTDGWMDEGFISYKGWQLSAIDMPQYASDQNKFTMFYAVNPSTSVRQFYFASALLSDGYFFYAPTSTQWFAEYGTYVGDPTGQAYQLQGFPGVWARDYTSAKVIVNPTSNAVTVSTLGYVDANGKPASQITLGSNDGVILRSIAKSTQLSLTASTTNPIVGQSVTFTVTLKSGTTPLNKPVKLWCTVNGVRIDGGTFNTVNGVYTFSGPFSQKGQVIYHAEFAGDSTYKASSGTVTVNVGIVPTTFNLLAASQSVNPTATVRLTGMLRTGATGLSGQPVELWVKSGTGAWSKAATGKTGTGTNAGWVSWSVGATGHVARTNQYYFFFPGTGTDAAAKSNVVTIKFENTKTTPYQTTLFAYAPKQVVAHGTTNTMYAKLQSGATPLTGKYVYVWKWSGGKWVVVSRIITRTAAQSPGAGWALAAYKLNNAGTGLYQFTFFGPSPYDRSTSNAVQLIWT